MSKDEEKEYRKAIREISEKFNLKNIDDESSLQKIFEELNKKYKTLSFFFFFNNPKLINIIKKVKEKNKKTVHYLLNIEPSLKKEIDYSNLDLNGPNINIDDKEKNLQNYLKDSNINITSPDITKKLNKEIGELGKKFENNLINEQKFLSESNRHWENYKKKKNLKLSKEEEDNKKNAFIEIKLKEESISNNDYFKFLNLLNAKKKYFYEKDIYSKNYSNDIIYKSNKTWCNSNINESEESSFPIKIKEMAIKKTNSNDLEEKDFLINNNNESKEYGNKAIINIKTNKIYSIFERDFEHFNKIQYNASFY